MTFKEVTTDNGYAKKCYASDNQAEYIITSAMGHDLVFEFEEKFQRQPTSRWYNRHFRFERIK